MAFRKVNGMARNYKPRPGSSRPSPRVRAASTSSYPGAGHHVEVDMSRQVMALADGGEAKYVFMVSTGTAATPSDPGGFTFYSKDPGYNSLGMYYSVYYNRGEATHGYHSVPPYPASHGCIRNPIPDSIFIYNWIDLGDKMFVYRSGAARERRARDADRRAARARAGDRRGDAVERRQGAPTTSTPAGRCCARRASSPPAS